MRKYTTLLTILLFVLAAGTLFAAEGTQSWIVSSTIKPVGEPTCDGKNQHQVMATVATFKDSAGKTSEVELAKWDQVTDKTCTEKSRGMMPDKPNPKGLAEAQKQAESKTKSRGGKCGCYYLYWDYGSYIYYEYYDCSWNYCAWEIVYR